MCVTQKEEQVEDIILAWGSWNECHDIDVPAGLSLLHCFCKARRTVIEISLLELQDLKTKILSF